MDLVQGSAALQRRARLELSAAQGPKDVAADIRKRFASLRRALSFVDWRGQKALLKDLEDPLRMIEDTVAPHDLDIAFELLWSFLQLAPSIHERTDDSNGAIGDVLHEAMEIISTVSPRISMDRVTLAGRILEAVAEAGYGEFDGIIPATADALGDEGLEHLRTVTDTWPRRRPASRSWRPTGATASPRLPRRAFGTTDTSPGDPGGRGRRARRRCLHGPLFPRPAYPPKKATASRPA